MKKPEPPPRFNPSDMRDFTKAMDMLYKSPALLARLAEAQLDYPYWEKFKRRLQPHGLDPVQMWRLIKQQRQALAQRIRINPEKDFFFTYSLTGKMQETLHLLDMQMGGTVGGVTTIPAEAQHHVLISSLMEEAIASSQLEGAVTSRVVAKEMLQTKRDPRNKSERMIVNNYITMKNLVDNKLEKITPERIMSIHRLVSQGTLDNPEDEGRPRTTNEVKVVEEITGEIYYDPPDFTRIMGLLQAVCDFANDGKNEPFIHPVIRGIVLHFLIGYIHPFVDGNGRTARALFYWYLLSKGYWLVEYLSISKVILRAPVQYARAYLHTEQDDNDLTYFILFSLRSLDLARIDLDHYLHRKISERKSLYNVIKNFAINPRQSDILSLYLREPERFFAITEVQARYNVSYQTARTDLLDLEAMGFIEPRKAGGKRLVFHRTADFEMRIEAAKNSNT